MKKIIKSLLCMILSLTVIGCGNSSTSETVTSESTSQETEETEETVTEIAEASEEFKELIAPFGLEDVDISFLTRSKVGVYGHLIDSLSLEIMGFSADSDIVKEMENIIYYNISNLTEDDVDNLESTISTYAESFKSMNFCTVEYGKQSDSLYIFSLKYTDMDNKENIQAVIDAGGLTLADDATNVLFLDYSTSCENLKNSGWIER